jgi:hypothetical protein
MTHALSVAVGALVVAMGVAGLALAFCWLARRLL